MTTVIKAENLGKKYIIGHQKQRGGATLRDAITHTARGVWQRMRHPLSPNRESLDLEELWALKDVNFEVQQGERIGIIGRNGAGKSTLLKVLSRITEPTTGKVRIKGRVSSLLEVGTGFHPELTGRENIYLNGAILGMTKQEIKSKFDEIIAFAELEKFLDTPVKRYSSGMYVRLAFAVAAHLEPEILIVDEVLAVGDAQFQKKCLGKMQNVAREGRTVLFVSHNMAAISNLCMKCIWIDAGYIKRMGLTTQVVHAYMSRSKAIGVLGEMRLTDWPNRYGTGEARILSACLYDGEANMTTTMRRTRPMIVEFVVESRSTHALHFSAVIVADSGVRVLHLSHHDTPGFVPGVLSGRYLVRFVIPNLPLCAGDYNLMLAIHAENLIPIDVVTDVLPFVVEDIIDSPRPYKTVSEYAYCWTPNNWSIASAAG